MEYYSAIKKNTFESVLMRWMKLEPIMQREVSQKGKHQYSILTHIYNHLILCYPLLLLPSIFPSMRAFHSLDKPCGRNSWDASIFMILMSSNQ